MSDRDKELRRQAEEQCEHMRQNWLAVQAELRRIGDMVGCDYSTDEHVWAAVERKLKELGNAVADAQWDLIP